MYSQVEKAKEDKSKAVSNSVAQKKRAVAQVFGFVDHRHEGAAITMMKKQSDHSEKNKNTISYHSNNAKGSSETMGREKKNVGLNHIIQCAVNDKVEKNILNVAGESHGDDKQEDDLEIMRLSGIKALTNYWTETTFKAHEPVPGEQEDSDVPLADPHILNTWHMLELAYNDSQKINSLMKELEGISKVKDKKKGWESMEVDYKWNSILSVIKLTCKYFFLEISGISEKFESFMLSPEGKRSVDGIDILNDKNDKLVGKLVKIEEILKQDEIDKSEELIERSLKNKEVKNDYFEAEDEEDDWIFSKDDLQVEENEITENWLGNTKEKMEFWEGQSRVATELLMDVVVNHLSVNTGTMNPSNTNYEERISATRSFYIHLAAKERKETEGLVKIGNAHVLDIINNISDIDYNLLPKNEYQKIKQRFGLGKAILYHQP